MKDIIDDQRKPKKSPGFWGLVKGLLLLSLIFTLITETAVFWTEKMFTIEVGSLLIRALRSFLFNLLFLSPIMMAYWPLTWFKQWIDKQ